MNKENFAKLLAENERLKKKMVERLADLQIQLARSQRELKEAREIIIRQAHFLNPKAIRHINRWGNE